MRKPAVLMLSSTVVSTCALADPCTSSTVRRSGTLRFTKANTPKGTCEHAHRNLNIVPCVPAGGGASKTVVLTLYAGDVFLKWTHPVFSHHP